MCFRSFSRSRSLSLSLSFFRSLSLSLSLSLSPFFRYLASARLYWALLDSTRLYSSLPNAARLYSTLPSTRLFSTRLDSTRLCSTLLFSALLRLFIDSALLHRTQRPEPIKLMLLDGFELAHAKLKLKPKSNALSYEHMQLFYAFGLPARILNRSSNRSSMS